MYKKILLGLFFVFAVVQLSVPVSMILHQERILNVGEEFKFRTQPVDPFDAFRGRYVSLRLEEDYVENVGGAKFKNGQRVFAQIQVGGDGFAKLSAVTASAPVDRAFIKARVNYVNGNTITLDLPIDRYYMEETKAPRAEALYRKYNNRQVSDAYVVVRVIGGVPVVKALYVAGKPIEELLKNGGETLAPVKNTVSQDQIKAQPDTKLVIFPGGNNKVVYSDVLTSGTGDEYCAQQGLECTGLVSCQLDMGGCKPSEYCGDIRSPSCPCTARCASSKDISDDEGQCGSCRWEEISCSNYGGYWTGEEVPCDPAHAGVIVMKHHNNNCGSQHLESYTTERWDKCFTPRAQCVCK